MSDIISRDRQGDGNNPSVRPPPPAPAASGDFRRIQCFMILPTGKQRIWLRRFASESKCAACGVGYHNAMHLIGDVPEKRTPEGYIDSISMDVYADDSRWPAKCACGYEFSADDRDNWQVFTQSLYQRQNPDGTFGDQMTIEDAPPGAIWNAEWLAEFRHGPDGQCLCVKMPGGHEWCIDGYASNCNSPCAKCGQPRNQCQAVNPPPKRPDGTYPERNCQGYEDSRPHHCWVRHGVSPVLTVDKFGEPTCAVGAGSIMVPGWHGYLRKGFLEQC